MPKSPAPASPPGDDPDVEPLEVGDIERRATVDIDLDTLLLEDSKVSVIEVIRQGEPPWVKLEISGEWGEVGALLMADKARDVRDRLTEVIEICEDADTGVGWVYLCDHCLRELPPEDMVEDGEYHYHPDCPQEPAAGK